MARSAGSSPRRPWVASAIRGWRVEIGLGIATFAVLLVSWLIAAWGPYFLIGCAGLVLWRRPDLRDRYEHLARRRYAAHRLHVAFWLCGILGRNGSVPTVEAVEEVAVGIRYRIRLQPGLHFALMESVAPELCAALSARQVHVHAVAQDAGLIVMAEIRRDPFPEVLATPFPAAHPVDLWEAVPFAMTADGTWSSVVLPEHNLLLGGEPGAGKSVALSSILAAASLDSSVTITLLDGKEVELAAWRPVANRFVGPNQAEAIEVLEELHEEMGRRYATLLDEGIRKLARRGSSGLHVVVIDELAFYLRGGKKADLDAFAELLRDLISRGRAAGIIVVAATQKPSHEIVPTWIRDLFSYRLAMRCSSRDASDTILGSGWAQRDFNAASIDPAHRGVGYLLAEGGLPVLIKMPFLSDDDIASIVKHAVEMRR